MTIPSILVSLPPRAPPSIKAALFPLPLLPKKNSVNVSDGKLPGRGVPIILGDEPMEKWRWKREESCSHSTLTLRNLIQGMPMFAIGVLTTLLVTETGKGLMTTNPNFFAPTTDIFTYSLLGLFSSSLASITFRRKLPRIASCFEDVTIICFATIFASLLCILFPLRHWVVFSLCLIPLLPLDGSPCVLLFRCFNWILHKVIQGRSFRYLGLFISTEA